MRGRLRGRLRGRAGWFTDSVGGCDLARGGTGGRGARLVRFSAGGFLVRRSFDQFCVLCELTIGGDNCACTCRSWGFQKRTDGLSVLLADLGISFQGSVGVVIIAEVSDFGLEFLGVRATYDFYVRWVRLFAVGEVRLAPVFTSKVRCICLRWVLKGIPASD